MALILAHTFSLLLVYRLGYPLLAFALLVVVIPLAAVWRAGSAGNSLHWCAGEWTLRRGDEQLRVSILPGAVCLPWVFCLRWAALAGDRRGVLWLFADSVPAEQLRRLRVRLTLQG